MPEESPEVAVDSRPRLSGIMDTLNATLAHGKATRLPSEFYDPKLRNIIETIGVEEWFSGYQESQEYRMVGIGSLVGDVVSRMVGTVELNRQNGLLESRSESDSVRVNNDDNKRIKFALSGCHDTTLAGFLAGFGTFKNELWPPFTSQIAVELFRHRERVSDATSTTEGLSSGVRTIEEPKSQPSTWLASIFGSPNRAVFQPTLTDGNMVRKPSSTLTPEEQRRLEGYYVRVRYNDRPVVIPGCKAPGNHLPGDESFCTLVSREGIRALDSLTSPAGSFQANRR